MSTQLPAQAAEDDYDSSADSDFDASLSPSSGGESDDAATAGVAAKGRPKMRRVNADSDLEMGSGDENIIAQAKKKRRKKAKGKGKAKGKTAEDEEDGDEDDDDDRAVGIRVKLRSGRGGQEAAKKKLPTASTATVDVESIWERMNNPHASQPAPPPSRPSDSGSREDTPSERLPLKDLPPSIQTTAPPETISIPHTYTFAGETHTSTKTVLANSPEARAYLASKHKGSEITAGPALRRPFARKGLLDPNPSALIKGIPSTPRADLPASIGGNGAKALSAQNKVSEWEGGTKRKKDVKLNTVEKSKLDWEQEVERQGLREELEKAEKSGGSYLGRMEFLGRAEDVREEEAHRWRMAGKT